MAASSPVVPTLAVSDTSGTGHAHFGRLLLAEWTKLRSVRSTYWSVIVLIIVFPLFCWLFPYLSVHNYSQATAAQQATFVQDPVSTIMGAGLYLGQLAIAVLGVMVTASEYSTGMIRSTLLASPHRVRMLAAKSVVFAVLVFVIGEVVAFVGFFIGQQTFKGLLTVNLGAPRSARSSVSGSTWRCSDCSHSYSARSSGTSRARSPGSSRCCWCSARSSC